MINIGGVTGAANRLELPAYHATPVLCPPDTLPISFSSKNVFININTGLTECTVHFGG
jgi:hypothetical protein